MKRYSEPKIVEEKLLVDEEITALESISGVDVDNGGSDSGTFGDIFGN